MFLKISQISQGNTRVESVLDKVETPTQVFSCEIGEIFKNIFFYRTPSAVTFVTKYTHVSAADLLHIRIGSLDWNESYENDYILE